MADPRWHADVYYHTANGLLLVEYDFEELEELHDLIERGPNWYALDRIEVRLHRGASEKMTIEEAENA